MCAACECVAQSLRATFEKRAESSSIAPLNVAMIQAGEAEPISVNTFQAILTIMEKKATNPADITQLFVVGPIF
jgi:hypothetical protein